MFKQDFPSSIILMRIGDFYDAFGADAVMVVEHARTSFPKSGEMKTTLRMERLQEVLNALVQKQWTVAIYEETRAIVTPRQRVFTQLVSEANPLYVHRRGQSCDAPVARPVVALGSADNGTWNVAMCYVQERSVSSYAQIDDAMAETLVMRASPPLICIRAVPAFARTATEGGCRVVGGVCECNIVDRLLQCVCDEYRIDQTEFVHKEQATITDGCAPISKFTLLQLGIDDSLSNTPSLAQACLTKGALAPLRNRLKSWLAFPPAYAPTLRKVVEELMMRRAPLPALRGVRPGHWRTTLISRNKADIDALYTNLKALNELMTTRDAECPLLGLAREAASGTYAQFDKLQFGAALCRIKATLMDGSISTELIGSESANVERASQLRRDYYDSLPPKSFRTDHGITLLYGRADSEKKLIARDHTGRINAAYHTTAESARYDSMVDEALIAYQTREDAILTELCEDLAAYTAELYTSETWALDLLTLVDHVRAVGSTWTCPYESLDGSMRCKELRPYWLPQGQKNQLDVTSGTPVVLTGANGGGKSTLLRSMGAVALLAQCGLLVPCAHATVPRFSHIFLRAGASDCASERRSSFASEMTDMRTMMTCSENALLLMDEPCRGTATGDGVRLLESILSHMSPTTMCIVSTHFQELRAVGCEWMQLMALVNDDGICVPSYRLEPGRCSKSLALRVALAAGLPIDIVLDARHDDDIDTLALSVLYKLKLKFVRMLPDSTPPPTFRSGVYVLLTSSGVYVGETDRLENRLQAHRRDKDIDTIFLIATSSKTEALRLETQMIQEFTYCNVPLVSVADGQHEVR